MKIKILDIGSGIHPVEGADTLDYADVPNLTYKHDCNIFPYPIKDESYDVIYANHVIEHLDDIGKFIAEIKRILKVNGTLIIKVPYVSSNISFQDPTHKHSFCYYTFDYFAVNPEKHMEIWFTPQLLWIEKRKLNFVKDGIRFYNHLIEWCANKFPIHYENLFKWILPARELEVVMRK